LQQHKKGVNIGDIECRYGLSLVVKISNHFPACVTPETKSKLIERGWALDYDSFLINLGPTDNNDNQ